MKKINKFIFGSLAVFGLTTLSAFAYNDHTGYVLSPAFPLDETVQSAEYSLTSVYDTIRVGNAGTIFTYGALPTGMVQAPHDFPIYLVDSDWGNADDYLKRYEGVFIGGDLVEVEYISTNYPEYEAIDSEGDSSAELYIEGTLTRTLSLGGDKDNSNVKGEPMFYFDIQVQ